VTDIVVDVLVDGQQNPSHVGHRILSHFRVRFSF
jgi:hypothetical protein